MTAQVDLLDEIRVVLFAGGGGADTGISCATGMPVEEAINHSADAIRMHRTNHPFTRHWQEDVFAVAPETVCQGRKVGILWASPDCTHFSKAKGGAPVKKEIRGLSWVILKWALAVEPRVMFMENVEEIKTWGPLKADKHGNLFPDPERKGETFQGFIKMLTTGIEPWHPALLEACEFLKISPDGQEAQRLIAGLCYDFDSRELVAADYGVPTIRKRFFGVFRRDGQPIVFPAPTHAKDGKGGLKKWVPAASIIDWTIPTPSIFESKAEIKAQYGVQAVRPLADNTQRRIIRGVDKFTIQSGKPFIVPTGYGERDGQAPRVHDVDRPLPTVVSTVKHNVCSPVLTAASVIQYHSEQKSEAVRGQSLTDPLMVVDASNRYGLAAASITEYYSGNDHGQSLFTPQHTSTSHDRQALTMAHIVKYFGGVDGVSAEKPLPTVTAVDHNAVALTHVVKFKGQDLGQHPDTPLHTITTSAGEFGAVYATVTKATQGVDLRHWPEVRALLNEHCGYSLEDDEVLLLHIGGVAYFISDIGLRMLTPRELYNAMGFPVDYIIDHDYLGKKYSKSAQVARCGNAVCPSVAGALVAANCKEQKQTVYIATMRELWERVAV